MLKRTITNRPVVIIAIALSCLFVRTVQCIAADEAKTTEEKQPAQQWKKHVVR